MSESKLCVSAVMQTKLIEIKTENTYLLDTYRHAVLDGSSPCLRLDMSSETKR